QNSRPRADTAPPSDDPIRTMSRMEPSTRVATDLAPEQARALDLLRSHRRFVITGHMRPDGDCIGAQAALSRVLESLGKDVWIINPDPPEARFEYLTRDCRYRAYQGGDLP